MIRIGDFARLARVSVRTLRHYEEEGLLHPVRVNAQTGYRYYGAHQLLVIQRIRALRDIGLSIGEIRGLLALDRRELSRQLSRHEQRLQEELATAAGRLRSLQATFGWLTRAHGDRAPLVRMRAVPSIVAYTIRQRVPSLGRPVTELFEHAEQRAASDRVDDSPFIILYESDRPNGELDVEVCVPVRNGSKLAGVRQVEGFAQAVSVTYAGSYSQSADFVEGLSSWLDATASVVSTAHREVYHRFGADLRGYRLPRYRVAQGEAEFVTELQLPVGASPTGRQ